MKRALVIAYFFPPLGGAGVQRTLKFVKYLPEFGWETTVVSTRSRIYPSRDDSLIGEIPASTRVVRPPALPLARWAAIALHKLGLMRLKAYVSWPDGGLGWLPSALLAAWREVRRERPDVLLSSSAPYASHLVALFIHRLTGIPWVADFRDEWAENPHLASQPRALTWLSRRAEQAIGKDAAALVGAADYFRLAGGAPFETITNGVDAADVPRSPALPPSDRFRLSFVGTLYGSIDLAPVLAALAGLIAEGSVDPRRFELRIVGGVWIEGFAAPDGVPLTETGYLAHEDAIAEMRGASALLLFVPEESLAPSGKIYEYMAAERPVLCVTRVDNLAARLVTEWDAGSAAAPSDEAGIAAALRSLYARWEADELAAPAHARERVLERYSRRELTRRLAGVLDAAAGR